MTHRVLTRIGRGWGGGDLSERVDTAPGAKVHAVDRLS